jgi:uncharacterized membrane protein
MAATARGDRLWLWGLIAFLSVGVGGYALFHVFTDFRFVPGNVLENAFPSPLGLEAHIGFAGVALIVGPFQFLKRLRAKQPTLHRWLGRIYVAACTIGGVAGGAIALYSSAGPIAGWGFFLLAVCWVPFTLLAWVSAMRRDFVAHERWMIRSFALTFGAVTLRIYLPVGLVIMGMQGAHDPFTLPYTIIAWIAWVPNLMVAEAFIRSKPSLRLRRKVAAAPA